MDPKWLEWAKRLQATAQNGLQYAQSPFDRERFEAVRDIAAEIMAAHTALEPARIHELMDSETGYATPKVDVRGVVFKDDTILMVREKFDGRWTVPGGWADVSETPSEAVVREIREEAGFETRATKILAVYDRSRQGHVPPYPFHVYKLFFQCELLGGKATTSIETEEVRFFSEGHIPAELSIPRVNAKQIARFFEHRCHPDWPTDFD